MKVNKVVIQKLLDPISISQNQLAEKIGVSKGYLSNSLNGRRGAGRKLLSGLLRMFPEESVASLTIERQVAV